MQKQLFKVQITKQVQRKADTKIRNPKSALFPQGQVLDLQLESAHRIRSHFACCFLQKGMTKKQGKFGGGVIQGI